MPVGTGRASRSQLASAAEMEQREIAAGCPTICNATGMARSSKRRQGDGGKAQHVDESRPAAQCVKRLGREPLGCGIAFIRSRVRIVITGSTAASARAAALGNEIGSKRPPRLSARCERQVIDLESLRNAPAEALVAVESVETRVVEARGLTLHDDSACWSMVLTAVAPPTRVSVTSQAASAATHPPRAAHGPFALAMASFSTTAR